MAYCMGCMREMAQGETVCPACGWVHGKGWQESYALPLGSQLHDGKYLVGRVLGRGGFGITYIGMDQALKLKVAIKEYYPQSMASRGQSGLSLVWHGMEAEKQSGKESFVKEARNMAKINQIPGVSQVRDIFYQNDTAYIVMNYVDGETLKTRLKRLGPMDPRTCCIFFRPVMESLAEAHRMGMLHRDISPDNIMVDWQGKTWIMDMGAAKEMNGSGTAQNVSETTRLVVRHGFSPTEQFADGGNIGPWTDVYALAATAYYCMTGQVVPDALNRLGRDSLAFPPAIPPAVQGVFRKALALRPEDRFRDIAAFRADWEKGLGLSREQQGGSQKRLPVPAILAAAAAVLVLLLLLGHLAFPRAERQEAGGTEAGESASAPDGTDTSPEAEAETIRLGTSNANLLNYGRWLKLGTDYEYYLSGDDTLYECRRDADDHVFYLDQAEEVCESANCLTTDGEALYFLAWFGYEEMALCKLEPGSGGMERLLDLNYGRECKMLQYAELGEGSYLYYLYENEAGSGFYTLYRYGLGSGETETVLSGDLLWYNLYKDALYYTAFQEDTHSFSLYRADFTGGDPELYDTEKGFMTGFAEEDTLFMYSHQYDTLLKLRLDGTAAEDTDVFAKLPVDYSQYYGYEGGWIYYTNKSDGNIHRVRSNGLEDTLAVEGHSALLICCSDTEFLFVERKETGRLKQISDQSFIAFRDNDTLLEIQGEDIHWEMGMAPATDFDYQDNAAGDGVLVTGYHGERRSFSIPRELGGKAVTGIGEKAFAESEVQEVGLPEGLSYIGENAFFQCEALSFIGLPGTLRGIDEGAFGKCVSLAQVDFPEGLASLGSNAFAESGLSSVYIPASVRTIGSGCFALYPEAGLAAFEVSEDNADYTARDGVLYYTGKDDDGKEYFWLHAYPSAREGGSYAIEEGAQAIFGSAFTHCQGLSTLEIPESLLLIQKNAFKDCGITEITVGASCKVDEDLGKEVEIHYAGQ